MELEPPETGNGEAWVFRELVVPLAYHPSDWPVSCAASPRLFQVDGTRITEARLGPLRQSWAPGPLADI